MKTQEFISVLQHIREDDQARFKRLCKGLPLGVEESGEIVVAHADDKNGRANHLCITGAKRAEFIQRLLFTLSCLYEKNTLQIFILSSDISYGKLTLLNNADVFVPYLRTKGDLNEAFSVLEELLRMRKDNGAQKYPRLLVVLDGLEEFEKNENGLLEIYKPFLEKTMGTGVCVVSGVNLLKSIFGGYPGAFVGIGNCLVTADGEGKTDVTFVGEDSSLSLPISLDYPCDKTVEEQIKNQVGVEE